MIWSSRTMIMKILEFKIFFEDSFHMRDLDTFTYFLRFEVSYSSNGILLTRHKYIKDLLKLANLTDNKICSTLMEQNLKLKPDDGITILNLICIDV